MPTIYDNMSAGHMLLDALKNVMEGSVAADFCVGYFNLRGWEHLAPLADRFPGTDDSCCRVLVGMERPPEEEAREVTRAVRHEELLDPPTVKRLQRKVAESFRRQLEFGIPTNQAEAALRRLAQHLRAGKVRVKLFLRHPLHAKLYLVHRTDSVAPLVGYVGSSNLTQSGLLKNGELNVDVLEQDAARKLHDWFHEYWEDRYSLDISAELADLIENSWVREELVRPFLVYLKMVYHLSQDARAGEQEFRLPGDLAGKLLAFQTRAVSLAAHHLHRRGGVLLGDVVGLGKTYTATAIARIFQEDEGSDTLILCPKNLQTMWQQYVEENGLIAKVVPISLAQRVLPELRRYRLVIIDESHNLRNREGARYQAIRDYIERNEPRCLLLTATPYNKQYLDLSNQLRLFLDERKNLGVRPEKHFQQEREEDFTARFQALPTSLVAFEQSDHTDDWRDLLRLYMVRRTRRFIMDSYAEFDPARNRHFLRFPDGRPNYFPVRQPCNLTFALDEGDPCDQYARLYRQEVVDLINSLLLPRYGLAFYVDDRRAERASAAEARIMEDLSRGGLRLMGFCRTNLFKRLESSGHSFILSVRRHILRNMVTLHAVENGLPVPIGTQDAGMLDPSVSDRDDEEAQQDLFEAGEEAPLEAAEEAALLAPSGSSDSLDAFARRAAQVYRQYETEFRGRFRWLAPEYFTADLARALRGDSQALCGLLTDAGAWDPGRDAKLDALEKLLIQDHPDEKVLVFTQFADTAEYLADELKRRGVQSVRSVTGSDGDPTALARRFSPRSNGYEARLGGEELRVLIATDVLSEGQNLQDCHCVVNFDLPWAIIRLIQRAGRVDRIGQEHDTIQVYSFLPAEGVERIIDLYARLRQRLVENGEVVGTDEQFFDEEFEGQVRDLYAERAGALDDIDDDNEVDLASMCLQIWNSASEADRKAVLALPPKVYAARAHCCAPENPPGVLVYLRTTDGNDTLVRVGAGCQVLSQSLSGILREAACAPETPALSRSEEHHTLVAKAVEAAATDENLTGGRLGPPRSVRRRTYERLRTYFDLNRANNLFAGETLARALDAIMRYALTSRARDTLGRQLRLGVTDEAFAEIVMRLYEEDRLVEVVAESDDREPEIVCSIGLRSPEEGSAPNA